MLAMPSPIVPRPIRETVYDALSSPKTFAELEAITGWRVAQLRTALAVLMTDQRIESVKRHRQALRYQRVTS